MFLCVGFLACQKAPASLSTSLSSSSPSLIALTASFDFFSCHHIDSFVASQTHNGQVLYITSNKLVMTLPNNTVFGFQAILERTFLFCRSSHRLDYRIRVLCVIDEACKWSNRCCCCRLPLRSTGEKIGNGKLRIPTRVSTEVGHDERGGGERGRAGAESCDKGQISTSPPIIILFFDSSTF